jgi:hypothetical protein
MEMGEMVMNDKQTFLPETRPRIMKTNLAKICKHVSDRITELGYNVYISFSNKSKSRYLEVRLSDERKIIARISDHPADKTNRWRYRFDIYTTTWRHGSVDYIEFLDAFKQIVGEKNEDKRVW